MFELAQIVLIAFCEVVQIDICLLRFMDIGPNWHKVPYIYIYIFFNVFSSVILT